MDVLVVDDEIDIGEILTFLIQQAGYEARAAKDAFEAGASVAQDKPPLIICDITMPGKNGIQLLEELKAAGLAHGVVMLTAHAESAMVVQALQLGAIDYVVKPFDSNELMSKLPAWVEIGRRLQETAAPGSRDPERLQRQLRAVELFRLKNKKLSGKSAA